MRRKNPDGSYAYVIVDFGISTTFRTLHSSIISDTTGLVKFIAATAEKMPSDTSLLYLLTLNNFSDKISHTFLNLARVIKNYIKETQPYLYGESYKKLPRLDILKICDKCCIAYKQVRYFFLGRVKALILAAAATTENK